mgnify:CR=1 FL=1
MARNPATPRHRLEIAVVAMIAASVIGLYLVEGQQLHQRVSDHQVHRTLAGLKTAVATTALDARGIGPGDNPVALLKRPPAGYRGEDPGLRPDAVRPGSWYFDPRRGALIHRPRVPGRLVTVREPPVDATPHLALRLTRATDGDLQLRPVGPWRWPEPEPRNR